jgi:hypothetical protein
MCVRRVARTRQRPCAALDRTTKEASIGFGVIQADFPRCFIGIFREEFFLIFRITLSECQIFDYPFF